MIATTGFVDMYIPTSIDNDQQNENEIMDKGKSMFEILINFHW